MTVASLVDKRCKFTARIELAPAVLNDDSEAFVQEAAGARLLAGPVVGRSDEDDGMRTGTRTVDVSCELDSVFGLDSLAE